MGEKKVLITGKTPPPIGGVTIHVSRLISHLKHADVQSKFYVLNVKFLLKFIFIAHQYACVHIHASNPIIRFYLVSLCKIFNTSCIVTIHGNIGRFRSRFKNWLDRLTITYATKPIVLNKDSLEKAQKWNFKSELVSAFISPDMGEEFLAEKDKSSVLQLKQKFDMLFCTNASYIGLDRDGNEIYGVFELIELFSSKPRFGLIISDPMGVYKKEIYLKKIVIPSNILIIDGTHSFYRIIDLCDASIRNTSTDGDSLSVKESLYLHKLTFATTVVERPKGCLLYPRGGFGTILEHIMSIDLNQHVDTSQLDGFNRLLQLYQQYSRQ